VGFGLVCWETLEEREGMLAARDRGLSFEGGNIWVLMFLRQIGM